MTEIFHTVERIEEKKPGCLGVNGAFAQSVSEALSIFSSHFVLTLSTRSMLCLTSRMLLGPWWDP